MRQIAARHGASNVRLFGSVARGEEQPHSDVDLLSDFEANRVCGDHLNVAEQLETLLHRHVNWRLARRLGPNFRRFIEAAAWPV